MSKFAIRRANANDTTVPAQQPGARLKGELTIPDGRGPFPIVLLFPDCLGWSGVKSDWPATFKRWGYASLKIFSIAARPQRDDACNEGRVRTVGNSEMVFDAMGAIRYLSEVDSIDPNRVAVMGWGIGATGALKTVNYHGFARLFSERVVAAIALYPACELHSEFLAPSLVLIGAQDKRHPVLFCQEMKRLAEPGQPAFELVIYPDLGHDFDLKNSIPSRIKTKLHQAIKPFLALYL